MSVRTSCLRVTRAVLAACCVAPFAVQVGAQQRWVLPAGGSAVFAADEKCEWFPRTDPKQRPALPISRAPHVPTLFASELDDAGVRLRCRPVDVRWLAAAIAFDLGSVRQHRIDEIFEWTQEFGHLHVRGSSGPVEADGTQTLELEVRTEAPRQGDLPDRLFTNWVERVRHLDAKGKLTIARQLDPQRGLVTGFRARLELDCTRQRDGEAMQLVLEQNWQLTEVRENRGAGFSGRVADGVRRAARFLHDRLGQRTRWDDVRETSTSEGPGAWALTLLALLHAECDPNDTVVRARLAQVRRAELTETYTLSLAILVLEKLYAPRGERDALISGALHRSVQREPSPADRALLAEWTRRLLANRDHNVDRAYVSRWSYTGQGYDNSNTQFALLALHAAALCGVDVSRGVWHSAAQHLLSEQAAAEAKPTRLQLIPHKDAREAGSPRLLDRTAAAASPRGFGYRGTIDPPYGAMTCAGISGATLCIANLTDAKGGRAPECAALEQAVRDGFAWLDRHRTLRFVAGDDAGHHDYWYYYWLYSLERACELSQTAWIGDWDWYADGAELLLAAQLSDGSWGNETDTCFALLFLKQAQLPVITGLRSDSGRRDR